MRSWLTLVLIELAKLPFCILDQQGETLLHKEIPAKPEHLLRLIEPYLDDLVIGVECMHCWYWVADFCEDQGIAFILGHALYMKAIHGGKTKNDRIDSYKIAALIRGGNFPLAYVYPRSMRATRDLLRRRTNLVRHGADLKAHVVNTTSQYNLPPNKVNLKNVSAREQLGRTFDDPVVQRNIDLDMVVLECYHRELSQIEWLLEKQAKKHRPTYYHLLQTIPGIGRILALTRNAGNANAGLWIEYGVRRSGTHFQLQERTFRTCLPAVPNPTNREKGIPKHLALCALQP